MYQRRDLSACEPWTTCMKSAEPLCSPMLGETVSVSSRSSRRTASAADSPASRARTNRDSRSTMPWLRSRKRSSFVEK